MKFIFLISILYVAFNWPRPSECWSIMSPYMDYGQATPLSAAMGQQLNQQNSQFGFNGFGNNGGMGGFMGGYKINPDLIMAANGLSSESAPQRTAFSRIAGNNGRARKASRFNLKPMALNNAAQQGQKKEQETAGAGEMSVHKLAEEAVRKLTAAASTSEQTKSTETVAPAAAVTSESGSKVAEVKVEKALPENKEANVPAAVEKKDTQVDSKVIEIDQTAKIDAGEGLLQKHREMPQEQPMRPSEGFVKMLNFRPQLQPQNRLNPVQQQFQHQQQQMYDQFQQMQHDVPPAEGIDELRFQITKPDMTHTVGLDTLKNEAVKVLTQRNEQQLPDLNKQQSESDVPLSGKYNNGQGLFGPLKIDPLNKYDGSKYDNRKPISSYPSNYGGSQASQDARRLLNGYDILSNSGKSFSSLIIIANSNSNSNLGVATLDPDLIKSFLAQFLGQSVDNVLKISNLDDLIDTFNKKNSQASSSYSNGYDKQSSPSYANNAYNKTSSSYTPYEATSKLSANIPTFQGTVKKSDTPTNSHSESTVLLKKETGENTKNLNYGQNPANTYSFVPYQQGAVLVINNVNDNVNDRVRSVLSGEGINTSEYNSGLVLPLSKGEIDRLMEDAIIINNDNRNKNKY